MTVLARIVKMSLDIFAEDFGHSALTAYDGTSSVVVNPCRLESRNEELDAKTT
jgi:hypothetical protein